MEKRIILTKALDESYIYHFEFLVIYHYVKWAIAAKTAETPMPFIMTWYVNFY